MKAHAREFCLFMTAEGCGSIVAALRYIYTQRGRRLELMFVHRGVLPRVNSVSSYHLLETLSSLSAD